MKTPNWVKLALNKKLATEVQCSFQIALLLANVARDGKNWPQAADRYREALAHNPDEKHLLVQLGHMLKELGDYAGAEQQYRQYAQIYSEDSDIHLQLGHLFNRQDRVEEALLSYERAARLAPDNEDIAEHMRRVHSSAGARPAAELRHQALALTDRRNWSEAYVRLVELIDVQGHADLNTVLGNVCKELGNFDEAWSRYRAAEQIARFRDDLPTLLDITMQMGHLCKIEQNPMQAFTHYVLIKDSALLHGLRDLYEQAWREIRLVKSEFTSVFE